ncbi:MAG: hypothetical protein ISN28_01260 [Ectothiorhodospiraceae bacterium AqS1]|nr:hypothetical protein [Ectothiorhodospiraceae bacterium AqS1]
MTAARKIETTVRVIRCEFMNLIARSFGMAAANVSRWGEGIGRLRTKVNEGEDGERWLIEGHGART